MAITLGTNVEALRAQTYLNKTTTALSKTMERLSTGLKINKAGDDAAGLVISENMEATIQASKQAMSNIQNANSFLDVAEDGMTAISDHFQRISDLLVNMANDTNDTSSRTAEVREIIERLDEIDRLARTTSFNGKNMLDGSSSSIIIQLGPNGSVDSTLDISPALTPCFVSSFNAELPDVLNPASASYNPNNANCREYLDTIQTAINTIASSRGLLGAYENRLDSSYDSLSTQVESLENAKSTYTDADVAEESTNLTSQQIMQQINTSILTTANSITSIALTLLS